MRVVPCVWKWKRRVGSSSEIGVHLDGWAGAVVLALGLVWLFPMFVRSLRLGLGGMSM